MNIELTCQGCSKSFSRRKADHLSNLKRGRKIVACSPSCVGRARYANKVAILEERICEFCSKPFKRKPHSKNDQLRFCSAKCVSFWQAELRRVTKICNRCQTNPTTNKHGYCQDCKKSGYDRRKFDWDVTTLNDLKTSYNLHQYHAKLRGMARSEFMRHNSKPKCAVCAYELHIDVCHIIAIKDFPLTATISQVNHKNNLVALCRNHHWEFDNGYINLPEITSSAPPQGIEPCP